MRYSLALLLAPWMALAAPLTRRAASANTMLVLQFAHVLEQLETAFYTQALSKFQASDFINAGFVTAAIAVEQFTIIAGDESTHTDLLEATIISLGGTPITTCTFDFTAVLASVQTMLPVARLVENVGVSAYLGAATLIDDPQILSAAASIVTVESRHQTLLNLFSQGSSIASPFDMALSPSQVLAIAGPFISGCSLGVPANPSLAITNSGTVTVGTQLTFSSSALNSSTPAANLSCQMLTGGAPFAISLPFDNCVVPAGINGLVYIFITNTDQPLLSNLANQFAASIVAGPAGAFIDTQTNTISQLLFVNSTSGTNTTSGVISNSGTLVNSTTTLSPSAASSLSASLASMTPAMYHRI